MVQNAEANILITIKQKGQEVLDGIKDGMASIIKVGALMVTALVAVGTAIGKLASDASQFEEIKNGFKNLASSQGANADTIIRKMKEASDGVLSTADIMKAANEAMLAGIPIDKLQKITEIAKAAANAQGDSVENMLSVMTNGLARTSTMMLRHVGIVFDEIQAYKDYAKSVGKTSEDLSDNEKRQVFLNQALKVGQQTLNKLGPNLISVSDQWERFKATQEDNAIVLGQKLIPAFRVFVNILEDIDLGLKKITRGTGFWEMMTTGAVVTLNIFQEIGRFFQDFSTNLVATGKMIIAFSTGHLSDIKKINEEANQTIAERKLSIENLLNKNLETIVDEYAQRAEKKAVTNERKKTQAIISERQEWENKYVQTDFETFSEQLDIKKKMEADALEERIRLRESAEQLEKQHMQNFVSGIQTATSQGLQGLTSKTLGYITEEFIPGAGAAVSSIFDLLSQSTDEFNAKLATLFGPEFIDNVLKNLITLVQAIPGILDKVINYLSENMPAIVEQLIASIIANLPKISGSLLKAFVDMAADPKFYGALASAIAKGFIEGIHQASSEISDAIKKAFTDALNSLTGGTGSAGGVVNTLIRTQTAITTGGVSEVRKLLPGQAHGGLIPAYAGGGLIDNQLIRAHAGEYVINKNSAASNMDLLNAINGSNGRGVSASPSINIVVNGGMLGDRQSAQEFARAVDEELYRLRQGNASRAFDRSIS